MKNDAQIQIYKLPVIFGDLLISTIFFTTKTINNSII